MSTHNELTTSSKNSDELEGKYSPKFVTVSIRSEAHKQLVALSEKHKMSQIEFLTNILLSLQGLNVDSVDVLVAMGRMKSAELGIYKVLPIGAEYLGKIGELILIPVNYFKHLVHNQK